MVTHNAVLHLSILLQQRPIYLFLVFQGILKKLVIISFSFKEPIKLQIFPHLLLLIMRRIHRFSFSVVFYVISSFPKSLPLISWNIVYFARFVVALFVFSCHWWKGKRGRDIWVWNWFYKSLVLQHIFLNYANLSLGINIWLPNPFNIPQILCVFCDASLVIESKWSVCLLSTLLSQSLMQSTFLINTYWMELLNIMDLYSSMVSQLQTFSQLLKVVDMVKLSPTFFLMLYFI